MLHTWTRKVRRAVARAYSALGHAHHYAGILIAFWVGVRRSRVAEWLVLTWRPVDTETLPDIGPDEYPDRLASLHLETGIAELHSQSSQAAVLDNKLAVAGGATLATGALVLAALSILDSRERAVGDTEFWLISAGIAALVFAFAHSVRGLWPRTYRALPGLLEIRELAAKKTTEEDVYDEIEPQSAPAHHILAAKKTTDEDVYWSIAVSVEQAVAANERVMKARVATVKLAYSAMSLGGALILVAFALHFGPW